ncbi:MAG: PLP-dependent aspartate aminotransferase family protein [Synergistaceae bacterium]|jgi:cystathionine beta-lyase|nr:PLP-dependent aspartate aminotransferase family protein [Synergistaceae bacterium]
MGIGSILVHGHKEPDNTFNAVVPPIYLTTTYRKEKFSEPQEFEYSRGANPTRTYFEEFIAYLEGGRHGFAFSSGTAANAAALSVLGFGEKVLVTRNVYGGTVSLLSTVFKNFGINFELVDTSNLEELEDRFDSKTKAVFIETPSNPLLDIADIRAISNLAKKHNAITIVDNTFLSPYFQKPLELGADIVVESATKFLSGHSDVIAGVAATNSDELAEKIGAYQRSGGSIAQPFDVYLLIRGIKTLAIRADKQVETTRKVIAFLDGNPAVDRIFYPGLVTHPGYEIHKKQARSPGALLSFELNGSNYNIEAFFDSLRLITHGASLGSVESLIQNPKTGSHARFTQEQREKSGIKDNLVRLSVGIEDAEDIIKDLKNAFASAKK